MPPSPDDFTRWREDRVTRWVFRALEQRVEDQRQMWLSVSWQGGQASPMVLRELQSRATAWVEVFDNEYLDWCEILNEEPVNDDQE